MSETKPIDDVITIWEKQDWKIWNAVDAIYARCDPDWIEEHQLPLSVVEIMTTMSNRVGELESAIAAAIARATQAEGERDRMRAALILANQILYEHHNVYLPRTELGYPCQVCKNSKVFTVIDAALAAPQTDAKGE